MHPRKINNNVTIIFNSDDGVDDALAQLLILAQQSVDKNMAIAGMVPTVGNVILGQTENNVRRILELVGEKNIPVHSGALTPLGLEKNVSEIDAAINATHFYGYDGLSDLPPQSWPVITIPLQKEKGYKFIAELVMNASPDNPITLVSTASLTEIYKALHHLDKLCEESTLPPGCYADNLIIVAMGGIIDLSNGPNAPFDRPDYNNQTCTPKDPPCKDAEANFYWDTPATQGVFEKITKYGIKMQLIPLDLTQQPGLLWTKKQVAGLRTIQNPVASQIANMTDVVPWIDAKHFPEGTYPWHDGLTSAWILWGETLFTKTPVSIQIGDHGQTLLNTDPLTKPNVDLIGIHPEKTAQCMKKVVELFKNFNSFSKIGKDSILPSVHTIFSELNTIPKMAEKKMSHFLFSDDVLASSTSPRPEVPMIWRAAAKLSKEIHGFFYNDSKNKLGSHLLSNQISNGKENRSMQSFVHLNTAEPPCYYSDGSTNIADQSGQQPAHAIIGECKLQQKKSGEMTSSGLMNGVQAGLIHRSMTQIFRNQGRSESEIKFAVEGIVAASIAAINVPAALLYIAINHIPNDQLNKREKELIGGFIFFAAAFSNPLNTFTSGVMFIVGYQLASYFVDTVADLLITEKSVFRPK